MAEAQSMSMENAFYSSSELIDLLFKGFTVTSLGGFIGVLIGIASISILYEGLRQVRDFFLNRFVDTRKQSLIYQYQQQQLQPSTPTSVGVQRRKRDRRGSGGSGGGSTKRCDSIRYVNINKRSPIDDDVDTIGQGGDAPSASQTQSLDPDPEPGPSSALVPQQQAPISNVRVRVEDLLLATLLHMVYITIGYLLMLAVMTFNVWIFVSVTAGVGIGYLMFGTFRRLDHLATHKRITVIDCCAEEGEVDGGGGGDRPGAGSGVGPTRPSSRGGGGRGLNPREDSVGPEGPLLASASNSCSSSHASDADAGGIGYGAMSRVKTSSVAVDEDEDGDSSTLVLNKGGSRQRAGH